MPLLWEDRVLPQVNKLREKLDKEVVDHLESTGWEKGDWKPQIIRP